MTDRDHNLLDIQAMQAVAKGDSDAFGDIIDRNQQSLLNFFYRMGAQPSVAEDLAQETFLRLYRWRARYEPRARFATFLFTLARHAWTDHLRRVMRRPKEGGGEMSETVPDPDAGIEATDLHLDLQTALGRLSEKLRDVVVLNVYQGLAYKEIAGILEIPEGTVKSRMFLALRELRGYLEQE